MTDKVETEMTMDDVMELLMDNTFFFQGIESSGSDWVRRILMKVENAEEEANYCETYGDAALLLEAAYEELWDDFSRINDVYHGYGLLEEKLLTDKFPELGKASTQDVYSGDLYFTLSKLGKEFLKNPPYRLTVQLTGKKHTDWLSAQILKLIKEYKESGSDRKAERGDPFYGVVKASSYWRTYRLIAEIWTIVRSRERTTMGVCGEKVSGDNVY